MSLPPEPPPLESLDSTDALYTRVIARGRRLRRERRAFLLTAGMSLLLLLAAVPIALLNDNPSQVATTDRPTTTRPARTTTPTTEHVFPPFDDTTTTLAPVAIVQGATVTTTRQSTATKKAAPKSPTTTARQTATTRPPTTRPPATTTTTIVPSSAPASPCSGTTPTLVDHDIAFVRGGDIWLANAGIPQQLTTTADTSKPAWAPNGGQLVFVRPGGLFTAAPIPAAPMTQLTSVAGDTDPAWSPDGGRIAFIRGGNIFTVPAGGGQAQIVRGDDAPLASPTWSPNSCDLAFTWKSHVLRARSADGSGVTDVKIGAAEPSWSSTGRLAVTGGGPNIYLVNPDGSGYAQMSTEGGRAASWKADGSTVVYQLLGGGIASRTASPIGPAVPVAGTQAGDAEPAW